MKNVVPNNCLTFLIIQSSHVLPCKLALPNLIQPILLVKITPQTENLKVLKM